MLCYRHPLGRQYHHSNRRGRVALVAPVRSHPLTPPNNSQQPTSGRYFGPALKRLGRPICDGVTAVANRSRRIIFSRGNGRAASLLACGAACSWARRALGGRTSGLRGRTFETTQLLGRLRRKHVDVIDDPIGTGIGTFNGTFALVSVWGSRSQRSRYRRRHRGVSPIRRRPHPRRSI